MFPDTMRNAAAALLQDMTRSQKMIATAESCTGGLIAALLTEVPGSSAVVERGFVTYSNAAKSQCLGVDPALIETVGAVSEEVARAMAEGAIANSKADFAVAVTGIAGPGGDTPTKPVGLVHIATAQRAGQTVHRECRFGDVGRSQVREETVRVAIDMLKLAVNQ